MKLKTKTEKTMNIFKYLFAVTVVAGATIGYTAEPNDRDMCAVQKFIDSKRGEQLQSKAAHLSLAGDVRSYYKSLSLKRDGTQMYGKDAAGAALGGTVVDTIDASEVASGAEAPIIPSNVFGVQFNLYTAYENGAAFADTWVSFDNAAGYTNNVGSGTDDSLSLKRALVGYHVMHDGPQVLDVMVGRDSGSSFFDSKVQHRMNLDGLFVRHNNVFDGVGNLSVRGSAHVIDQSTDHWGWTGQIGLGNIAESNFSLRYTYNNFKTNGDNYLNITYYDHIVGTSTNDVYQGRQWEYQISELYAAYDIPAEMLSFPASVYAAYGINHAAQDRFDGIDKSDSFWYAGFTLGALKKANDWSVDVYYAKIDAQALPSADVSLDGRGNTGIGDTTTPTAVWAAATAASVNDRANIAGWTVQGAYNLTDELALGLGFFTYSAANEDIGGNNDFRQLQAELVYAF